VCSACVETDTERQRRGRHRETTTLMTQQEIWAWQYGGSRMPVVSPQNKRCRNGDGTSLRSSSQQAAAAAYGEALCTGGKLSGVAENLEGEIT
jgi:hypothetical protein